MLYDRKALFWTSLLAVVSFHPLPHMLNSLRVSHCLSLQGGWDGGYYTYWRVVVPCWIFLESSKSNDKKSTRPLHTFIPTDTPSYWVPFLTIKNDILVTSEISTSILLTFLSKSGVVKTCFFSKFNYVKKSMDVFKIMEEDKWQSQPKNGRFAYD